MAIKWPIFIEKFFSLNVLRDLLNRFVSLLANAIEIERKEDL